MSFRVLRFQLLLHCCALFNFSYLALSGVEPDEEPMKLEEFSVSLRQLYGFFCSRLPLPSSIHLLFGRVSCFHTRIHIQFPNCSIGTSGYKYPSLSTSNLPLSSSLSIRIFHPHPSIYTDKFCILTPIITIDCL